MANVRDVVPPDMILSLREQFINSLADHNENEYDVRDIERAKTDDYWIARFLYHQDLDVNNAMHMLVETCKWRKENNVNDISKTSLSAQYFEKSLLYSHNRDKENHKLLILCAKNHVKNLETFDELKKYVLFWVERLEKEEGGERISLFFDMTDSGYANMDTEFIKYIIHICKSFYPSLLAYIFVFELPWILKAAWKIISSWLPSKAARKIEFINRSTISDFIDPSQQLVSWGGLDPYVYSHDNLVENVLDATSENKLSAEVLEKDDKKKVKFQLSSPVPSEDPKSPSRLKSGQPDKILSVEPEDELEFVLNGDEVTSSITLTNKTDSPVIFKVKTTKPDKFRVRPNAKVMSPHEVFTVNVMLFKQYHSSTLSKDKFLIMATPMHNDAKSDHNEFWKNVLQTDIQEIRLKSRMKRDARSSNLGDGLNLGQDIFESGDLIGKMDKLIKVCGRLEREQTGLKNQMNYLIVQLFVIIVGLLAVAINFYIKSSSSLPTCKSDSNESPMTFSGDPAN